MEIISEDNDVHMHTLWDDGKESDVYLLPDDKITISLSDNLILDGVIKKRNLDLN